MIQMSEDEETVARQRLRIKCRLWVGNRLKQQQAGETMTLENQRVSRKRRAWREWASSRCHKEKTKQ